MVLLETERLYLRSFNSGDLDSYYGFISKEEVYTWLGNRSKRTVEQARKLLEYFESELKRNSYGVYAVIEKENNRLIGQAGFNYLKDLEKIEYLYALDPAAWGKGYATEVGKCLIDYYSKRYPETELIALAYEGNIRSNNVLNKLGFISKGTKEIFGSTLEYFEREKKRNVT